MKKYCESCKKIVTPKHGVCPVCGNSMLTSRFTADATLRRIGTEYRIFWAMTALFFGSLAALVVCLITWEELGFPVFGITAGVDAYAMLLFSERLRKMINAYSDYGDYETLYAENARDPQFASRRFLVGKTFTFDAKKHWIVVKNEDVLCAFPSCNMDNDHKTFTSADVCLYNRYGEEFSIPVKDIITTNHIGKGIIDSRCLAEQMEEFYPDAKISRDCIIWDHKDCRQYIKQYKEPRPGKRGRKTSAANDC